MKGVQVMSVLEQERVGAANGSAGVSAEIPARIVPADRRALGARAVRVRRCDAHRGRLDGGVVRVAAHTGVRLPFAALFGGLAQFLAGMWAYPARGRVATAVHGTWGTFWMGYGVLFYALFATGTLVQPRDAFPGLAMWFVALAAITAVGALAALAESGVLFGFLVAVTLTTGSVVAAIAYFTGSASVLDRRRVGPWSWRRCSPGTPRAPCCSRPLTAGSSFPSGDTHARANIPGSRLLRVIEDARGEPGVRRGQ